jgi:hypothetical protein
VKQGDLVEEARRRNFERPRELLEDHDRRIAGTALDVTDVGPVNARFVGKHLLAPALLGSEPPKVLSKALTNVHAEEPGSMSLIHLQTMSDIPLD